MNHVFCTDCGNKIEYAYSKPKFCSSCGSKVGGGPSLKKDAVKKPSSGEVLAADETDIDFIPDIDRISVDIEQFSDNVFTLESLSEGKTSGKNVRSRGSKTLEDFIDDKRR